MTYQQYLDLKKAYNHQENERIFAELDYAWAFNKVHPQFDELISQALDVLKVILDRHAILKMTDIKAIEKILLPLGKEAKKETVLCVAHAHIDINWMWGYDETVSVTTSTIETMISLLEKYDDFTFAQSQGLVYDIIAKYRPDLLMKIRRYVKEGRFEVTAATYVEADKNMSDAETQFKQIIYNRVRLEKLLDISGDSLDIDFEPDTFGHSAFVPEILASAGVKYYYHCRGNECPPIYRWFAPSGKSILVYREPQWYLGPIQMDSFNHVPDFCARYGVNKVLKVYGVGDHGGGASIRDIERIIEMGTYPIMPTIKFGTYHEFFAHLATLKHLPKRYGEQNQIFSGCYSSNDLIKQGNYKAQVMLHDADLYAALTERHDDLSDAYAAILTNEFHDILPGSATENSCQYAHGRYQEAYAMLGESKSQSLRSVADVIDTLPLFSETIADPKDIAVGAGVGFANPNLSFSNHIAYGRERAFVVFNSLNYARQEVIKIPLWDYYGDVGHLEVIQDNKSLPFFLTSGQPAFYWYHNFHELNVLVDSLPLGYSTLIIRELAQEVSEITYPPLFQRIEEESADIVLENDYLRATFDRVKCTLISLVDKHTHQELLSGQGEFKLIMEDTLNQMTSWYIGRYKNVSSLHQAPRLVPGSIHQNELESMFAFDINFSVSSLRIEVRLKKHSPKLEFKCVAAFFEKGGSDYGVPQISFSLPLAASYEQYDCDVPLGTIKRQASDKDVPCSSFVSAAGVTLMTRGKYGFRADGRNLQVTLLRASYDPHPYPDYGNHEIEFAIGVGLDEQKRKEETKGFKYPLSIVATNPHKGYLSPQGDLLKVSSNIDIVSITINPSSTLLCLFNDHETTEIAHVACSQLPKIVAIADNVCRIKKILAASNNINVEIAAKSILFLRLTWPKY